MDRGILIDKLIESRCMSKKIGKSLIEIRRAMEILMKTSQTYKPFTVRAARYFFIVQDLEKLNPLYQFTHKQFYDFIT